MNSKWISLLLEGSTGNETSQCLILFTFAECLPPVGVLLRNDVKDIALHKTNAEFLARDVEVVLWIVIKMSFEMNHRIRWKDTSRRFGDGSTSDWNNEEGDGARHGCHKIADVVDWFATHFDAVHFHYFIAFVQQTRTFGNAAANNPTNHHSFTVIPHGGALFKHILTLKEPFSFFKRRKKKKFAYHLHTRGSFDFSREMTLKVLSWWCCEDPLAEWAGEWPDRCDEMKADSGIASISSPLRLESFNGAVLIVLTSAIRSWA